MDALSYFCTKEITEKDIYNCAINAGYSAELIHNFVLDREYLRIKSDSTKYEWRWNQETLKSAMEDVQPEEKKLVSPEKWDEVVTTFDIEFAMIALKEFAVLMRKIFECFGGFIIFESMIISISNIDSMSNYRPPPIIL